MTKQDEGQLLNEEQDKCRKSFEYFLLTHVWTLDSQMGRGRQKVPDWEYLHQFARDLQENRQVELLKSRQMMISWILAAFALWSTMYKNGQTSIVVSKGGREAGEIGDRVEYIHKNLDWSCGAPAMQINKTLGKYSFPDIDSKFMCLPADPDIGRTFSAGLIIFDEMAFFPWGSQIMASLAPMLGGMGRFIGVSTPNGRDGLFYPTWHDANPDVKKIQLHYSQRPDMTEERVNKMRNALGMTEQKWMREMELSFATPAGKPVYPTFSHKQVIPDWRMQYAGERILVMGWDRGYHHPATIWAFINRKDQLVICRSIKGEDVTRGKYIVDIAQQTATGFADFTDRVMWVPSDFRMIESDGGNWIGVMEAHGLKPVKVGKAGKDEIPRRVDAVRRLLKLRADGECGVLIDQSCTTLIEGLAGGYTYPEVIDKPEDEKPLKDGYYDHEQNALEVIADNHFDFKGPVDNTEAPSHYEYDPSTGMRKQVYD
jgi:hypothetical protein